MIERVILLSGPISCGKTTLAERLASKFNIKIFRSRDVLRIKLKEYLSKNRRELQLAGERLDKRTKGVWVRDALQKWLQDNPSVNEVIVDSVRIMSQIEHIRESYGARVIHVHLTAPLAELEKRYRSRKNLDQEGSLTYAKARDDPTEQQIEKLSKVADVVIDTKRCLPEDVLVRVVSHLNIRSGKGRGYVDVLVGGQYGSEGKGQIAAYLAPEYDLLVRVGGPNAGHTVYEEPEPFTHHHLPSGTRRCEVDLLIGPGATLNVEDLLQEIAECQVEVDRLRIDQQAMIITEDHIKSEKKLGEKIGSTKQGVGAAMAARINERYNPPILARDVTNLKSYIANAVDVLERVFSKGGSVLLEGTQGTGLSLYHGKYPYVTSRDTTVSGCLSEAGISPDRVRRVIMVCRTYPIRVTVDDPTKGTSGPMSQEINWDEVGKRSGLDPKILSQKELTSTTSKLRRVGEFDWALLRKATLLNRPTDIALTFTDYLTKRNIDAKRFEQLDPETINFIQEVELVAGARVSLISTGFNPRCIIDRRSW